MTFNATSGATTANSYVTVAEADSHVSDRGNTTWDQLTTTEKERYLVKATDYIEKVYAMRWNTGQKSTATQRLSWPRAYAYYPDEYGAELISGIPREVKEAQIEMALLIAGGENPLPTITRETKSEQVGSLRVEYMDRASPQPLYPQVSGLLSPLVSMSGSSLVVGG